MQERRTIKYCFPSFGWLPGHWISCVDVSEHSVSSIFIGDESRKNEPPQLTDNNIYKSRQTQLKLHIHTECYHWATGFGLIASIIQAP